MPPIDIAKRIINAINKRDKEQLKAELSSLTSLELVLFLKCGYKFLLPDIFKIMELPDGRRDTEVVHPDSDTNENRSDRAVPVAAGSSEVCD
jgi:hypothetical protein